MEALTPAVQAVHQHTLASPHDSCGARMDWVNYISMLREARNPQLSARIRVTCVAMITAPRLEEAVGRSTLGIGRGLARWLG